MPHDERDVLGVLKAELDHIEKGGYGRSVRTPHVPTLIFRDSLSCLNYGYPYRAHPCSECLLDAYVPPGLHGETLPCHHIPLGADGVTVEDLERGENQAALEERVKEWLRAKIGELEVKRARS